MLFTSPIQLTFYRNSGLRSCFSWLAMKLTQRALPGIRENEDSLHGWYASGLGFGAVALSGFVSPTELSGVAFAIALGTTALGTLMPILKERNLLGTRVGDSVLAYGTWGELGPIIAMAYFSQHAPNGKPLSSSCYLRRLPYLPPSFPQKPAKQEAGYIGSLPKTLIPPRKPPCVLPFFCWWHS